jgi:S-adenosylmethionine-diacylglycerol 3-amino-3-carboxypropyl transferase
MTQKYFESLNYSLGNEDTTLERSICQDHQPKKIMSIAGCGGRALPLIVEATTDLFCIDVSKQQLYLTKLREQSILKLSYHEFLKFWSYPPYDGHDYTYERRQIYQKLDLPQEVKSYFDDYFEKIKFNSLLYEGKWEKTFIVFSKIIRAVLGKDFSKLFTFVDLEEQIKFYREKFPYTRWMIIMGILGNKSMFNAILYKGDFIKKNIPESYISFYKNAFDYLFTTQLARENFFLNLCFFGKLLHESAYTIEAKESCFLAMKDSLNKRAVLHLKNMNLTESCENLKGEKLDFVSLSDVPSYFSGELEKNFLQDLKPCLSIGALVVVRYYLKVCEVDESGFENVTGKYQDYIKKEKVQMYRTKVLKYLG